MKKLNIALVGLGNIGSYLYKYLNDNKKILTEKNNCSPVIKYVSARNKKRKRNSKIKKNQWLKNYLVATTLKEVDLIVELIGGAEGAADVQPKQPRQLVGLRAHRQQAGQLPGQTRRAVRKASAAGPQHTVRQQLSGGPG